MFTLKSCKKCTIFIRIIIIQMINSMNRLISNLIKTLSFFIFQKDHRSTKLWWSLPFFLLRSIIHRFGQIVFGNTRLRRFKICYANQFPHTYFDQNVPTSSAGFVSSSIRKCATSSLEDLLCKSISLYILESNHSGLRNKKNSAFPCKHGCGVFLIS